ncbi:uncharacterized protein LOC143146109 [Ptiloglossa arizonensis]|uniref:uncharacterized protein LOC143146109 n=1 Tax=Ptiloglossa arizonensis TaxID=3350558 RepID=UPI003FA17551
MKRCEHGLCSLFILGILATRCSTEELTLNVDFGKPISVTDEKFLSLTVDPWVLLHETASSVDLERSLRLAKALSPAYVRLGGPHGTLYRSVDQSPRDQEGNRNVGLSESDWVLAHQWAKNAGLEAIVCIPVDRDANQQQISKDTEEIVALGDRATFDANWQLGYECQTRCNVSAIDLARRVVNLRRILNGLPKYSNSILVGPDIVAYKTKREQQYLRNYFNVAAPALSAITWHPDFNSVTLDKNGVLVHPDNLDKRKEKLSKFIGRFLEKRPLWIAESKPEECKNLYLGALVFARRLGDAAKLKAEVIMRQPMNLTRPTPDYWVSLLHKTLVGREVFNAQIETGNKSHVYLYCQCARPSNGYGRGSVTIFGANLSPEAVEIALKGTKLTTIHEYVLSPGSDASNGMFAETVLLNNEPLTVTNDSIPKVKPAILNDPKGLRIDLPSGGIGFWVLPELKVKSCTSEGETRDDNQDLGREEIVRVIRSVQEKRNEREQRNLSRSKTDARMELERLKYFVRKKLDDYHDDDAKSVSKFDTQSKLHDFVDRFSRIRDLVKPSESRTIKNLIDQVVAKTVTLISEIQGARSSGSVVDRLESLYDLLIRGLTESIDGSKLRKNRLDRRANRSKRYLFGEITEPFTSLRRNRPKVDDEVHTRIRRREEANKEVRPSVVKLESSDSGENTFYGFFENSNPVEGFAKNDVFFSIDGPPRNHNYLGQEANDRENDRRFHETGEYSENPRTNDREAEFWEAESYENRRTGSPRGNDHDGSKFRSVRTGQIPNRSDRLENWSRTKRESPDLRVILDQEMINQDDANSKDCNCRVIRLSGPCVCRSRRDTSETSTETVTGLEMPEVVNSNLDDLNSHDVTDVEVFSGADESPMEVLKLQTDASSGKREVETFPPSESSLEIPGDIVRDGSDPPLNLEALSTDSTSSLDEDSDSKTEIRRETFFLGESDKIQKASIDSDEDPAGYSSNSREYSPSTGQNLAEETTEEIKVPETETSNVTFEPTTLSDESIAKEPENDYGGDKTSSKRQVEAKLYRETSVNAKDRSGSSETTTTNNPKRRTKTSPRRKNISIVARPRESRLTERANALLTMKKIYDERRRKQPATPGPESVSTGRVRQHSRNRTKHARESRGKSRDKQQDTLEVDKIEDEERRNLKRREAWETFESNEDFQDATDSEESDSIDEAIDGRIRVTKMVGPRHVRERTFDPSNRRNDPRGSRDKILRSRELYENEDARGERFNDDQNEDQPYFALVENFESPRIFYHRQPSNERKKSVQLLSPHSYLYETEPTYHPVRCVPCEKLEIVQDSSEEDEKDFFSGREVYIIDPSTYRGGDPALKLYKSPSKASETTSDAISKKAKAPREKVEEITNLSMLKYLSENLNGDELSEFLINVLHLKTTDELLERLRRKKTAEKQNVVRSIVAEPREKVSPDEAPLELEEIPVSEKSSEESQPFETPVAREVAEREENHPDPSMDEEMKIEEDNGERNSNETEGANVRRRRDTNGRLENNYSKWLSSFLVRKLPRKIQKTSHENCLCLGQGTEENPPKVFAIVKEKDYYEAVKEATSIKLPKDSTKRDREFPERVKILIPSESSDEYSSIEVDEDPMVAAKQSMVYRDSSDERSTSEQSEERSDYADENTSDVLEIYTTAKREDESGDRTKENANTKDLLYPDQPGMMMVLPWSKGLGRLRRQTPDPLKGNAYTGIETVKYNISKYRSILDVQTLLRVLYFKIKIQSEKTWIPIVKFLIRLLRILFSQAHPLQLQRLEVVSSPKILTNINVDDVEKSMARKIPLEKYTEKNLPVNYINDRRNPVTEKCGNEDRGLSAFIKGSIPKLQDVVVDGLKRAQNFTGTVERLIENTDEKFNQTSDDNEENNSADSKPIDTGTSAFRDAIKNVKKFFALVGGITHILQG